MLPQTHIPNPQSQPQLLFQPLPRTSNYYPNLQTLLHHLPKPLPQPQPLPPPPNPTTTPAMPQPQPRSKPYPCPNPSHAPTLHPGQECEPGGSRYVDLVHSSSSVHILSENGNLDLLSSYNSSAPCHFVRLCVFSRNLSWTVH